MPTPSLVMVVPWLTLGGADHFNLALSGALVSAGWRVTLITTLPLNHDRQPEFERVGAEVYPLHELVTPRLHAVALVEQVRGRSPDAVMISNSRLGYLALPSLRAARPRAAIVDYCHMEEPWWRDGGYARDAVDNQPLLDLNIVASEHLRRWMIERGADGARVEVCRINVDTDLWRRDEEARTRVRLELGLGDEPALLYAARLCEQKRPLVVVETARELAAMGVRCRVLVAGGGPDLPAMRRAIEEAGLRDRVLLLGPASAQRVRELMSASDVLFLPSKWEGIALSIYEAMSMSLPVVGADVGGQRELVEPGTGVLLPAESSGREYAAALARVLGDGTGAASMGRAARARVEAHFRLDQMRDRMIELLDRARELAGRSPRTAPDARSARLATARATQQLDLPGQRVLPRWLMRAPPGSPRARDELRDIERSRAWRLVRGVVALLRDGPDDLARETDARARLARVRASRSFRLIDGLKRTWAYRLLRPRR